MCTNYSAKEGTNKTKPPLCGSCKDDIKLIHKYANKLDAVLRWERKRKVSLERKTRKKREKP